MNVLAEARVVNVRVVNAAKVFIVSDLRFVSETDQKVLGS